MSCSSGEQDDGKMISEAVTGQYLSKVCSPCQMGGGIQDFRPRWVGARQIEARMVLQLNFSSICLALTELRL
jgi:hypothetical protein